MADTRDGTIEVEVVYAQRQAQTVLTVRVVHGADIEQAIIQSRIIECHPEIDLATAVVGIYGQRKSLSTVLNDGDRIEIYRTLLADPKQARRKRARRGGRK